MELGSKLYYKLTDDDDDKFNEQAEALFDGLVKMLPKVLQSCCLQLDKN